MSEKEGGMPYGYQDLEGEKLNNKVVPLNRKKRGDDG